MACIHYVNGTTHDILFRILTCRTHWRPTRLIYSLMFFKYIKLIRPVIVEMVGDSLVFFPALSGLPGLPVYYCYNKQKRYFNELTLSALTIETVSFYQRISDIYNHHLFDENQQSFQQNMFSLRYIGGEMSSNRLFFSDDIYRHIIYNHP